MSDVAELVSHLVAIDSVNPDLVPGGRGEHAIATFVAGWLDRAGLDVTLDEPVPGRPNVIAVARGTGGGRSLMLNGHLDTVGVAGMQHPHAPKIVGDRLYGRGAYDMKGGLAAIMLAGAAAAAAGGERHLRGDVIVTAVIDEEHASLGTQRLLQRWHADAAVVAEATGLDLCIAHKGFVWLDVEVTGEAAHGSRPDLGIDAIVKMGNVLAELDQVNRRLQASAGHPLLGAGSVHASLISGGQERSSYPASCTLGIERRTIPGETPDLVEAEIQHIIDQVAAQDPHFRASVTRSVARGSFAIPDDAPIVQVARQALTTVRGRAPALIGVPWWMDSALLADAGIPTVVFGPGGAGAHAMVEWVSLDEVERCAATLIATVYAFCA